MSESDSGRRLSHVDSLGEGREVVQTLCEMVFGDDGGRLENVRLAWEVPPAAAGREGKRDGWRVYQCDVVGYEFSVPHGAPIPVILADHYDASDQYESTVARYVHPDLVGERGRLNERFVESIWSEIRASVASLSTAFNLLHAIQELEDIPDGSSSSPYHPVSSDETVGYDVVGDERPSESDSEGEGGLGETLE